MSATGVFMIVPSALLSALIWIVLLAVLLYAARVPVHRVVLSASRGLHRAFRMGAFSVQKAEERIAQRNREVLLAQGREAAERVATGACLVQLYTGLIYRGPTTARDINEGLLALLERDGFDSVTEAVGADLD